MPKTFIKRCVICGEEYQTTKDHAKYCPPCRKIAHKKKTRKRGYIPAVTIEEAIRMSMATGKTYGQLQREGKI